MPTLTATRRWLAHDSHRSWLSLVPLVLAGVVVPPADTVAEVLDNMTHVSIPVSVAGAAVLYVLLTWAAFRGLRGVELTEVLRGSGRRRSGWRRWVEFGDGPVAWSLVLSGTAMITGVSVARTTGAGTAAEAALSLITVACAWATMTAAYAVQYARMDATDGGLHFPGDEDRGFLDYLYLAVTVSTAFTTSDVTVTRQAIRRTMTGNAVIAFVFSTVVLATVLTVL